jgi:integration host factor subunit beta
MTRSELIEAISARFPQLHQKDAGLGVALILGAITDSLVRGERSEIRGFGSFSLNYRKPRIGRNPKSGDRVEVPAKWSPHFKAGKELRERVDVRAADYL